MAPTGGKGPFEEQGGGRRGKALSEGEFLTDDHILRWTRRRECTSSVSGDEYAGPTLPGLVGIVEMMDL